MPGSVDRSESSTSSTVTPSTVTPSTFVRMIVAPIRSLWSRRARAISLSYIWLGLAAASITIAGAIGSSLLVLAGGAALFVSLVRLGRVIRNDHDHDSDEAKRTRWWTRLTLAAILAQLIGLSTVVDVIADELEFLALVTGFVLISSLINELRFSHWPNAWRGLVVMVATALLTIAALWVVPSTAAPIALITVVAAVMLGHLGIVLSSEDQIDRLVSRPSERALSWPVSIAGIALLIIGFALLRGTGLTPGYSVAVVAGFVVVIATAASKGDGDLLAIIVALTLIWAAAPRSAPPPDSTRAADGPAVLVVGDSFISGEGADRFIDGTNERRGNRCRRAASSWAVRVAEYSDVVPDTVIFRACSGSKADAITSTITATSTGQLANLEGRQIDVVIVSIGGNDAGFTRIGQACLAPGDCAEVAASLRDRLEFGKAPDGDDDGARVSVQTAIETAYANIRAAVGDEAVIIAVPYPRAIQLPGCEATLLQTNEHHFIDAFTGELNAVIRSAAARRGVLVLEPMEHALVDPNLQLCDDDTVSDRGINFIEASPMTGSIQDTLNPANWINNSLHPNERGHDAMLDAAIDWFEVTPLVSPGADSNLDPHPIASVDELADGEPTCSDADPSDLDCTDADDPNRWLLRQSVLLGRCVWWRVGLIALGAWLATVPAIAEAHRREWTTARFTNSLLDRLNQALGRSG